MLMAKLWYSLFDRTEFAGELPYFIEPSENNSTIVLESNYLIIKEELLNFLSLHELPGYFNSTMVEKKNTWKTISLNAWSVEVYENHKYFPKTLAIIKSLPGVVSSSFSMLTPHAKILPHCGDTNGIFRCHLGLSVPATLPACGFRVGNEWKSWEEGKLLLFIDANNHEAINNSNENRLIMIIDIIRPEFIKKKQWICATVLTSLLLQKLAEKFPLLYKSPLIIQKVIAEILIPLAFAAIPVRNILYRIKK